MSEASAQLFPAAFERANARVATWQAEHGTEAEWSVRVKNLALTVKRGHWRSVQRVPLDLLRHARHPDALLIAREEKILRMLFPEATE